MSKFDKTITWYTNGNLTALSAIIETQIKQGISVSVQFIETEIKFVEVWDKLIKVHWNDLLNRCLEIRKVPDDVY